MKKIISLVLVALFVLAGVALAEGNKIGYTCMDGTNPFFVALEGAIREVVEANGDELISLDPQNSNEKQLSLVEDIIAQGDEGIADGGALLRVSDPGELGVAEGIIDGVFPLFLIQGILDGQR